EHGWSLDNAEVTELMKKNNVVLVSTDTTVKVLKGFGWNEANAKEFTPAGLNA
ncbi:MAG: hypothetical protein HC846_05140, partial [Blastocatellia bacterium]|nr:hypothetical protein [Blastocatellia bacterium]